jgi:hypothetical protein
MVFKKLSVRTAASVKLYYTRQYLVKKKRDNKSMAVALPAASISFSVHISRLIQLPGFSLGYHLEKFDQIVDSGPYSDKGGNPEVEYADIMHIYIQVRVLYSKEPVIVIMKQKGQNCDYLKYGFKFSQFTRGNDDPFRGGDAAKPGDNDLPAEDNQYHPGRDAPKGNYHDECGSHYEFVRYGVQKLAEQGYDPHAPGNVPVQPICYGGQSEQQGCKETGCFGRGEQEKHKNWNNGDSEYRQKVGNIKNGTFARIRHERP